MLKELITWVETRPRLKDKDNLDKMRAIAKALNNPQNNYKTIHITGTNGKGSTAHFIHAILSKSKKVGLYTSPYIMRFNERIQIEDVISDEKLLEYLSWFKVFIEEYEAKTQESFTFFEIMTLLAFKYFSDEKVDYAIIEVGIGGTLDCTNIINSELSIITSIGFDHEKQLGHTLESILDNKLGILKDNKPLITAVQGFDEHILKKANKKGVPVFFLDEKKISITTPFPLTFTFEHHTYKPKLQGLYQVKNAVLAIMAVNYLEPKITVKEIKEGIMEANNPGRFEVVGIKPYIILDGAHNPSAIKVLADSLQTLFPHQKKKVLFACMHDKPYLEMLAILKTLSDDITLTTIDYHRALDVDDLDYPKIKDPQTAFKTLRQSLSEDEVLIITGSLYFVSYIRSLL